MDIENIEELPSDIVTANVNPTSNSLLKRTKSIGEPQPITYNTVRISCHGEYTTNSFLTFSDIHEIEDKYNSSMYIKFHVFFRAKVGECVFARHTTLITTDEQGKTCPLSEKENRDFGSVDFKKELVIVLNKNNPSEYYIVGVGKRNYKNFPNISFSFNTNYVKEGMYLGYALYNTEDSYNFTAKEKCGFQQIITLLPGQETYTLQLINNTDYNLIYRLLNTYKNTDFSGLTDINIYISSCLYVRPKDIGTIILNYKEWFDSHKGTIKDEYLKENQLLIGKYMKINVKLKLIKEEINRIKNSTNSTDISKLNNIKIFLKILQGFHSDLQNYVENYLNGEIDKCPIDELNDKIDVYDTKGITDIEKIKNELIENLESDKVDLLIDIELNDDDNPELTSAQNKEITWKKELDELKVELDEMTNALKTCSTTTGKTLQKKSNSRYKPYGGGKKMKKTVKKKKITLKRGALTKQAKSHGYKDVMKFARLTMRLHKRGKKTYPDGKRITKLLVKRSNFAINFNKKK
jgi:hypothetical protein